MNCLLNLARTAAVKFKVTPPSIIQFELEIEDLEQKRKAGTLNEDEDDLEDEVATTSRAASGSVSLAPGSPLPPLLASPTAAGAGAASPAPAPASPAPAAIDTKAAPETPTAAAAPASPSPAAAAASPSAESDAPQTPTKPKFKHLPYVPNAGSEIDVSIGKVLNNNSYDISVKPVVVCAATNQLTHSVCVV